MIDFATASADVTAEADLPWKPGRGQVEEPALHQGWKGAVVVLLFAGYLLQYPVLVLTAVFFVVLRYGAHWYSRRALQGVEYRRRFSQRRAFPDEEMTMTVEIANHKWLPVTWLAVVDHWAEKLPFFAPGGRPLPERPAGLTTLLFSLRGREQIGRSYRLCPPGRGIYPFGPIAMSAGDPFGLFTNQVRMRVRRRDWLVVYPRVMPLEGLELPYQAPFGDVATRESVFRDPVRTAGVRDYRPEDSFRHIHWKASARRQNLQVRIFEPTTAYTMVLALNVATFARHWEGTRPEILERAVCAAASIASYAVERHWLVGLTANGAMPNADQPIRVPPGRGPDQLSFLLEALAGVTNFTTSAFERFLLQESSRVAWGATLVVLTAVVSDGIRASLDRLRAAGRRVVLVALTAEPPGPSPDLPIYYAPNEGLAFDPTQPDGGAYLVPIEAQSPVSNLQYLARGAR
ncbi:MAG: DUF58 domain-containing protein [Anaerolineae bacterium]|jgi:uncharacterized protein (DUF58 family)